MLALLLASTAAFAADAPPPVTTTDIGVLKDSEIRVVQKMLYVKDDRTEFGAHLGVMPFDGFTFAPQLAVTGTLHPSETLGFEVQLGGGYGFKTARYLLLESETYGVAVEAYRYLGSATATAQWSPVYAKVNLGQGTILHHDVYLLAGAGLTIESSVLPGGTLALAPTLPLGIGARVWVGKSTALRFELRDNLMIERRSQSQTTAFKQNVALSVGISSFSKAKR
jgi:outer membrane beta-barrel protein